MSVVTWLPVLVLFTADSYPAQVIDVHNGDTVTVKITKVISYTALEISQTKS